MIWRKLASGIPTEVVDAAVAMSVVLKVRLELVPVRGVDGWSRRWSSSCLWFLLELSTRLGKTLNGRKVLKNDRTTWRRYLMVALNKSSRPTEMIKNSIEKVSGEGCQKRAETERLEKV